MGAMEMPLPENTLPMMTGYGQFGPMEMGGMFSVVRVRGGSIPTTAAIPVHTGTPTARSPANTTAPPGFERHGSPSHYREDDVSKQRSFMAFVAALLLGGATEALACAQLVRAVPAAGVTLLAASSEVALRFSERLEPAFSSAVVRDSAGKQIDKGDGKVDKGDRTVIRVSLPSLEPGIYKVEWKAVSADTHKVSGDFTFKVRE
jgi:copper resistance protein C